MTAHSISLGRRTFYYCLWIGLALCIFWKPCVDLVRYSLSNENTSHVVVIPLISAWLIFVERKQIFPSAAFNFKLGAALFALGLVAYLITWRYSNAWTSADQLSGYITAFVILCISGFALFFGSKALRAGRFALLFLFFTVPFPEVLLNGIIYLLQKGSADIAGLIFDLARVPVLREGFVFHLAQVNIEVAKECSGIRSSMALLILALLFAHLLLRTFWRQALFVAAGLLIMIVKNGVRIATLTILAQYVDPGFLYGRLHREGGVVFFLFGLLLLLPLFWVLERGEKPREVPAASAIT